MSLNQILLIGNAGRDAELRHTPNGAAVANFSMAVSRRYQVRDEVREQTEWFNVSAWERSAEFVADRVKRGTRVFVDGRLSTREYTAGSGETRTSLDVNANRVIVLTPRETNGESHENGYPQRREETQAAPAHSNGASTNGHHAAEYAAAASADVQHAAPYDDPNDLENLPW